MNTSFKRAAFALGLALAATNAAAWGPDGHSIVAEIAQRRLGPTALAQVEALLGPGHSLAAESAWADDVRPARPETFNWHFVDIPIGETAYGAATQCAPGPKGDCIVAALERLRTQLGCGDDATRREALRFAVHFVGDIHQPLHTVDEAKGGNEIKVDVEMNGLRCPRCTPKRTQDNLHAVWDTTLIANTVWNWGAYVRRLENGWLAGDEARAAGGGSPQDWAVETHAVAREIWPLLPESRLLGDDYYFKALPALDRQLGRAGMRLAAFLDNAFTSAQCPAPGSVTVVGHALPPPPSGVAELRFANIFRLPAGPRGLEPMPEFVALDGRMVRIVGYRVRAEPLEHGGFIIAPFAVTIGDDDENLSDDLPASSLYVDADDDAAPSGTDGARLVSVTGVLHVGATRAQGRILPARIDARANRQPFQAAFAAQRISNVPTPVTP